MADGGAGAVASLSDRLSITALVISLIALIIGISSFLQAILGTAEGYRKCDASVIGPWSKLRRRVFRWSEFRYETRFQAPLIKILTSEEYDKAQRGEYTGNIFLLNEKAREASSKQPSNIWYPWKRYEPADILKQSLHLPGFWPSRHEQQACNAEQKSYLVDDALGDVTRTLTKSTSHGLRSQTTRARPKMSRARDTLLVSWIRFMHELHIVCGQYWPNEACTKDCYSSDESIQPYNSELVASLAQYPVQQFYGRQWNSSPRTKIAVIILEWTWDFMPTDVTRPLAYSTLGHVIILALRLGMQWRTLDRTRSQLSADGNGRNITSTDVRGLGMVLRFGTTGRPDYVNLGIIPSRAADKLMCGIVPGDADLVQRDFPLINGERKLTQLWEPGGVYAQLGLDENTSNMLELQNRWSTHNEIVTLLCSFLPLPGSSLRAFLFSSWKRKQYSVFHFFEPRLKFLTALRDMKQRSDTLNFVLDQLEALSNRFKYAFYATYVRDKPAHEEYIQRQLDLTELCANAFRRTTRYFMDQGYHVQPENAGISWYLQLVAAHARLSAHVNEKPDSVKAKNQDGIQPEIRNLFNSEGIESNYFATHLWNQTELYIKGIDNDDYGVVKYMQRRGFKSDPKSIRDAWWMLMLRGIIWDLSCDCNPYPGEPVVSSYFSDETPVWFT